MYHSLQHLDLANGLAREKRHRRAASATDARRLRAPEPQPTRSTPLTRRGRLFRVMGA
jgi:hypothetical protein